MRINEWLNSYIYYEIDDQNRLETSERELIFSKIDSYDLIFDSIDYALQPSKDRNLKRWIRPSSIRLCAILLLRVEQEYERAKTDMHYMHK